MVTHCEGVVPHVHVHAIYVCLSGSWLGGLPFLFSYASVLSTCISMYMDVCVWCLWLGRLPYTLVC